MRKCKKTSSAICKSINSKDNFTIRSTFIKKTSKFNSVRTMIDDSFKQRVVFFGNSITDAWASSFESMFPGKPYVGRGISGQTTPQMLVRFRQDVVSLNPSVVVILAGTNDIAGNTGPSTQAMIEDNLISMSRSHRRTVFR